jgi:hypothetical protein
MVVISVSLKGDLYDRLRDYCKRNNISMSFLLRKLIEVGLPVLEEQERLKEVVMKRAREHTI